MVVGVGLLVGERYQECVLTYRSFEAILTKKVMHCSLKLDLKTPTDGFFLPKMQYTPAEQPKREWVPPSMTTNVSAPITTPSS